MSAAAAAAMPSMFLPRNYFRTSLYRSKSTNTLKQA